MNQVARAGGLPEYVVSAKEALTRVLGDFDVPYAWTKQTPHTLTVEFTVFNKRLIHEVAVSSITPTQNIATGLRQKLKSMNAPMKPLPPPTATRVVDEIPLSISVPPSRVSIEPAPRAAPPTKGPEVAVTPSQSDQPSPPSGAEKPVFPEAPQKPPIEPARISSEHVYGANLLKGRRVLLIDLPGGLAVPDGNLLVVPLEDPQSFTDMPKRYAQAIFDIVPAPEPERPPAPIAQPEPPPPATEQSAPPPPVAKPAPSPDKPVIDLLRKAARYQRNTGENAGFLEMELPEFDKLMSLVKFPREHEVPVEEVEPVPETGVLSGTPAAPETVAPIPSRPAAAAPEIDPNAFVPERMAQSRSIAGISRQIARQMAAIEHVQRVQQKDAVLIREVAEFLDPRDAKQVSARMPKAVELGFAVRQGHPLGYAITESGSALLRKMHTWPWLSDDGTMMTLPSWANY